MLSTFHARFQHKLDFFLWAFLFPDSQVLVKNTNLMMVIFDVMMKSGLERAHLRLSCYNLVASFPLQYKIAYIFPFINEIRTQKSQMFVTFNLDLKGGSRTESVSNATRVRRNIRKNKH